MPRTFHIFRHTPGNPAKVPHLQDYALEEAPGMTLFIALNRIREEQDPSLAFDFVCRAGVCGSCAMVINGLLFRLAAPSPPACRPRSPSCPCRSSS